MSTQIARVENQELKLIKESSSSQKLNICFMPCCFCWGEASTSLEGVLEFWNVHGQNVTFRRNGALIYSRLLKESTAAVAQSLFKVEIIPVKLVMSKKKQGGEG